jgi:rare lipoprotein A (peptidoglycan hydrolase)
MPSTTDLWPLRQARGQVLKVSCLLALLTLGACVPSVTFQSAGPTTQAPSDAYASLAAATALDRLDLDASSEAALSTTMIESLQDNRDDEDELDLSMAREVGIGSWYGGRFHGRRTSSGERFNQNALTAAHRTLPFGTRVLVTNLENGQSVEVRITDRGPRSPNRVIDLSREAATKIGMRRQGLGVVQIDLLPDLGNGILAEQSNDRARARRVN